MTGPKCLRRPKSKRGRWASGGRRLVPGAILAPQPWDSHLGTYRSTGARDGLLLTARALQFRDSGVTSSRLLTRSPSPAGPRLWRNRSSYPLLPQLASRPISWAPGPS